MPDRKITQKYFARAKERRFATSFKFDLRGYFNGSYGRKSLKKQNITQKLSNRRNLYGKRIFLARKSRLEIFAITPAVLNRYQTHRKVQNTRPLNRLILSVSILSHHPIRNYETSCLATEDHYNSLGKRKL